MPTKRALLALALTLASHLAAAEQVGMIVSLKGSATVLHKTGNEEKGRLGGPIFEGDRITTGFQSFLQIDFLDHSKINLMGSSDVTIDQYTWSGGKESTSSVKIDNGALGFMAGKIKKVAPENYKVHTASATVGIRGSSGELQTSDGSLPGVPEGFAVMMTGGEGLTIAAGQDESAPVVEVSDIGAGIAMAPGQEIKTVTFAVPPTQSYTANTEKKVASGRSEVARQEKGAPASQAAEKKPTPAAPPTQAAEKKAPAKETSGGAKKAPAKETAAPADKSKVNAAQQGKQTAEAPPAPKNRDTASLGAPPPPPPADAPPMEAPPPIEVVEEPVVVEIDTSDLDIDNVTEDLKEETQEIVNETQDRPPPPVEEEDPHPLHERCGYVVWEEIDDDFYCEDPHWPVCDWTQHTDPEETIDDTGGEDEICGYLPEEEPEEDFFWNNESKDFTWPPTEP